ncbi:MAG: ABC transporter permease, partial [Proteobacteria bacterium]|nr:ABC transporter permease [Pseudomonadota bacterium]
GLIRPLKTSCTDHMGSTSVRIHSWDGSQWKMQPDWYEADKSVIDPMVKEAADRYAAEKQIKRRDASDCNA